MGAGARRTPPPGGLCRRDIELRTDASVAHSETDGEDLELG